MKSICTRLSAGRSEVVVGMLIAALVGQVLYMAGEVSAAGLSGVSYTLTPSAEWLQWNDDLGLEDDVLYGGRLSLNFGRYIAIS